MDIYLEKVSYKCICCNLAHCMSVAVFKYGKEIIGIVLLESIRIFASY